jgi:hypothetical protein
MEGMVGLEGLEGASLERVEWPHWTRGEHIAFASPEEGKVFLLVVDEDEEMALDDRLTISFVSDGGSYVGHLGMLTHEAMARVMQELTCDEVKDLTGCYLQSEIQHHIERTPDGPWRAMLEVLRDKLPETAAPSPGR